MRGKLTFSLVASGATKEVINAIDEVNLLYLTMMVGVSLSASVIIRSMVVGGIFVMSY